MSESKEPIAIDGPDVIHFINENQATPALLEELSAIVVKADEEHARKLGVETTNLTFLRSELDRDPATDTQPPGYALRVCFFKADDMKDPSGWKELLFFLAVDENKKINQIIELGEQPISPVLNLDQLGAKDEDDEGPFSSGAKVGGYW